MPSMEEKLQELGGIVGEEMLDALLSGVKQAQQTEKDAAAMGHEYKAADDEGEPAPAEAEPEDEPAERYLDELTVSEFVAMLKPLMSPSPAMESKEAGVASEMAELRAKLNSLASELATLKEAQSNMPRAAAYRASAADDNVVNKATVKEGALTMDDVLARVAQDMGPIIGLDQ